MVMPLRTAGSGHPGAGPDAGRAGATTPRPWYQAGGRKKKGSGINNSFSLLALRAAAMVLMMASFFKEVLFIKLILD